MAENKQLFSIIKNMRLADYYNASRNEVVLRDADNMPFIRLPNGVPCLMANAYMLHLYKRNLSRRERGGTLRQYASDISHLIRFCYFNKQLDYLQINKDQFTRFMEELRAERDPENPEVPMRESNTLNAIGRKCLAFLEFVGRYHDVDDFVENAIQGQKRVYHIKAANTKRGFIERKGWYHESFDTASPVRTRAPISKVNVAALYDAISKLRSTQDRKRTSTLLERRRVVMLRLLEMTGGRIGEIAEIRVKDVLGALRQKDPKLRMVTLKKGVEDERYIPVLRQDLVALKSYIRLYRARTVRMTIGSGEDHGYLFVSETTGKRISSRTMSNEVGKIRRAACIGKDACAHSFRHRFITKLFVRLINQYDFEAKSDFRRALLDAKSLKQEVQQYTGHKSLSSLDCYIDLAFDEVANLQAVVSTVNLQAAYDTFDNLVEQLHRELRGGLPVSVYLERYSELQELRVEDVARLDATEEKLLHELT